MRRDSGQEQDAVVPERDGQESSGGDGPQPRQPQIPETRNETRWGIRSGEVGVECLGHAPLSIMKGSRAGGYREKVTSRKRTFRPATKELVVSKPWWLGSGGFDSGRSFLTTRLNRFGGGEVG